MKPGWWMLVASICLGGLWGWVTLHYLGPYRSLDYTFAAWAFWSILDWVDTRRLMRRQKEIQAAVDLNGARLLEVLSRHVPELREKLGPPLQ